MSDVASRWAGKQKCDTPAAKLILLALAHLHNPNRHGGKLFPSRQWLCDWTGLSKNSIRPAINKLIDRGQVIVTGERWGTSQRITVYRLPDEATDSPKRGQSNGPKSGQSDGPQFDGDGPQSGRGSSANWDGKGQNRDPSIVLSGVNECGEGVGTLPANPFLTVGAV
jgi:hypothetical protein